MDFERILTLIVIPIFVGVTINQISNKEKSHQNVGSKNGGFNFELSFNFKIKMDKK